MSLPWVWLWYINLKSIENQEWERRNKIFCDDCVCARTNQYTFHMVLDLLARTYHWAGDGKPLDSESCCVKRHKRRKVWKVPVSTRASNATSTIQSEILLDKITLIIRLWYIIGESSTTGPLLQFCPYISAPLSLLSPQPLTPGMWIAFLSTPRC